MKYNDILMSSADTHRQRLANMATRSDRNKWAENLEPIIRDLSPFPISYDVTSVQPANFSEYTYTEFAGGVYILSQSVDINCRLMAMAAQQDCGEDLSKIEQDWKSIVKDKYNLEQSSMTKYPEKVIFTPANNCLDQISWEVLCRAVHEDDSVMVKPHPIIDPEANKMLAQRVGWNKLIPKKESGMQYMLNSKEVYASSCSELSILAALFDKKVHNLGNFFHESEGAYYPMTRQMFSSDDYKQEILRMMACDFSGLIFPWHSEDQVRQRVKAFFDKSLELRDIYSPLYVRFPRKPVEQNGGR